MAFITQRGEKIADATAKGSGIGELEALVSGVNQISQSTLLLKKMKEMHEVDDSLDYMKEQYKNRMEACDERQREFERRQSKMKDQVTKFEKFIQENDNKRSRADMKRQQERSLYKQKNKEHETLKMDLLRVQTERDALKAQVAKLQKYEKYLEDVVHLSDENGFEEILNILDRHTTLKKANADLMQQVQEGEHAIDHLRGDLGTITAQHTNQMLVQNSMMHSFQKQVEEMRGQNKLRADGKERMDDEKKNADREAGQVMLAIRNLYMRCITTITKKVQVQGDPTEIKDPMARLKTLEASLNQISERITSLQEIEQGFEAWNANRRAEEAERHRALEESKEDFLAAMTPVTGGGSVFGNAQDSTVH